MNRDFTQKLDKLHRSILLLESPTIRRDLTVMYRHCTELNSQLSSELVKCRRLQKLTPKYESIAQNLQESIQNLDNYLVYGLLSGS